MSYLRSFEKFSKHTANKCSVSMVLCLWKAYANIYNSSPSSQTSSVEGITPTRVSPLTAAVSDNMNMNQYFFNI